MLDLLVRGGDVVGADAIGQWDIGVHDGKIVSLTLAGVDTPEAARVVDASGLLVVPGGVEPHAHLAHYISMRTEAEMYTLGPEEDTVGMIFGGVTTHIDFCQIPPETSAEQGIQRRMDRWRDRSLTDYAFHVNFLGATPIRAFEQIPEVIQAGFPSFKVFTSNVLPPVPPAARVQNGLRPHRPTSWKRSPRQAASWSSTARTRIWSSSTTSAYRGGPHGRQKPPPGALQALRAAVIHAHHSAWPCHRRRRLFRPHLCERRRGRDRAGARPTVRWSTARRSTSTCATPRTNTRSQAASCSTPIRR